jgi:hypothetical protein
MESEEEVTVSYNTGGELDVQLETNINLKLQLDEKEDPKRKYSLTATSKPVLSRYV